ncbi:MAG: YfhO family protein, partial [Lachnospiraceae bacterium]|nr:YfhO family protein [Lachnospiraceae bacterium]
EFGNDRLTGVLSTDKDKLLCMTIPYSIGWSAFVDGQERKVYRTNDMFMAIAVPAGEHSIEFKYTTPFYSIGCVVTFISLFLLAIFIMVSEKYKKQRV